MTDVCLLNLVVAPGIEDAFSDWLLSHEAIHGFSSHAIAGHGSSEHSMSLAEQVAGHRGQILFQLHLPCEIAYPLLDQIRAEFKGSGVHYWLVPVLDSGHV